MGVVLRLVWTLAARSAFILLWVGSMAVFLGVQDATDRVHAAALQQAEGAAALAVR
jgi:hypothetical protein